MPNRLSFWPVLCDRKNVSKMQKRKVGSCLVSPVCISDIMWSAVEDSSQGHLQTGLDPWSPLEVESVIFWLVLVFLWLLLGLVLQSVPWDKVGVVNCVHLCNEECFVGSGNWWEGLCLYSVPWPVVTVVDERVNTASWFGFLDKLPFILPVFQSRSVSQ